MSELLTEELLDELLSSPSVEEYLERRRFDERGLSGYLQSLLTEKGLVQAQIVRAAQLNPTFGYQVFMGTRGAGRNTVLQIAFAMGLTPREANRALQAAGANALYPKSRRDAIIIFCLQHGVDLVHANETLYRFGEETVC